MGSIVTDARALMFGVVGAGVVLVMGRAVLGVLVVHTIQVQRLEPEFWV